MEVCRKRQYKESLNGNFTVPAEKMLWMERLFEDYVNCHGAQSWLPFQTVVDMDEGNPLCWTAILPGPVGSPYEGGNFAIKIQFPADYPFSPPKMNFTTQIYHPNISTDENGDIAIASLDVVRGDYTPTMNIDAILCDIYYMLLEANPYNALNREIGDEYLWDYNEFAKKAREWTNLYAHAALPKTTDLFTEELNLDDDFHQDI